MKAEGFLIDMDGVIFQDSIGMAVKFIFNYISGLTPISIETIRALIRLMNCFPPKETFVLLFTALGITEHISDFSNKISNYEDIYGRNFGMDEYFEDFIRRCRNDSIKFRIFSLASAERIINLLPFIKQDDIYLLSGKSKADSRIYKTVGKDLDTDLKKWVLIDDDPFSLRSAKINGMSTVMMMNDVFGEAEYQPYKEYIDVKVHSFMEIIKNYFL